VQAGADALPHSNTLTDAVGIGDPIDPPDRNSSEREFQPDSCPDSVTYTRRNARQALTESRSLRRCWLGGVDVLTVASLGLFAGDRLDVKVGARAAWCCPLASGRYRGEPSSASPRSRLVVS
jgi:hypothetical protein